jgi:CRP/FNR family transcriptional regulator, anaerobic regulatory protein
VNKLTVLAMFNFYRDAPVDAQTTIAEASIYAKLLPGTVAFLEGRPCRHLVAVGAGAINTFRLADRGREIALFHVGEGRMSPANIMSVLVDRPSVASARVDTAAEIVLIPSSIVRAWVATIDPIRISLMETLATGLAELMNLVEVVAFQTIDSRLSDLLLRHFAERRVISTTHEKIAAELGTTREVVSRLLKRYEGAGAIRIARSRLELIDGSILHRPAFSLETVDRRSPSHVRRAW